MNEATIRNIIQQEFRALQQRLSDRIVTKADLNNTTDRLIFNAATKQDIYTLKVLLEDLRSEIRLARNEIHQHSAYIESLERNTKNNTNQLGSLWRLAQQ
jgi:predicted  nucleic acid-binding Zn-ribbon protein